MKLHLDLKPRRSKSTNDLQEYWRDRNIKTIKPPTLNVLGLIDLLKRRPRSSDNKNTNKDEKSNGSASRSTEEENEYHGELIPDIEMIKHNFKEEGRITEDLAIWIVKRVTKIMKAEKNVLDLKSRKQLAIFGDIHGQYFDLLNILNLTNKTPEDTDFLFLGDYVDRGYFGCEVILLLYCLKINYPNSVHLLRGNHECRLLTTHFNFRSECVKKFNLEIYNLIMTSFDAMPISALIHNQQGTFLCLHGGLSPSLRTLQDFENINRFAEPPKKGALCDVLWSDPLEDDTADGLDDLEMNEWRDVGYEHNPTRGCGYIFGYRATLKFLNENDLTAVIRAHEVQRQGFCEHRMHRNDGNLEPMIYTVFSAPNYLDFYDNTGAYLLFGEDGLDFVQFDCVPHPFCFPKNETAIEYTLESVVENIVSICKYLVSFELDGDDGYSPIKILPRTRSAPADLVSEPEMSTPSVSLDSCDSDDDLSEDECDKKIGKIVTPSLFVISEESFDDNSADEKPTLYPIPPSLSVNERKVILKRRLEEKRRRKTSKLSESKKLLKGLFQKKFKEYKSATKKYDKAKWQDLSNERRPLRISKLDLKEIQQWEQHRRNSPRRMSTKSRQLRAKNSRSSD